MSPVWMIEGDAPEPRPPASTDQRVSALAAAIRDHESRSRHNAVPARPEDLVLYRRLRQICGER
jgi:hypothetical protein